MGHTGAASRPPKPYQAAGYFPRVVMALQISGSRSFSFKSGMTQAWFDAGVTPNRCRCPMYVKITTKNVVFSGLLVAWFCMYAYVMPKAACKAGLH